MPTSLPTFYLPATLETAQAFLAESRIPDLPIERAALFSMLMALKSPGISQAALTRTIMEGYELCRATDREGVAEGLSELRAELSPDIQVTGVEQLANRGIFFSTDAQMEARLWCGPDGRYTDDFQNRCRDTLIEQDIRLPDPAEKNDADEGDAFDDETESYQRPIIHFRGTRDQIVATTAFAAARSEPIGVTATAGSGKTHLMMTLAEHARGKWTHLAPTDAHRDAFLSRIGSATQVTSKTLASIAHRTAIEWFQKSRDTRIVRPPRMVESHLSLSEQVARAGVPAIGKTSPVAALQLIFRAIGRWCFSSDHQLGPQHLGWRVAPTDQLAYIGWAQRIWAEMFAPIGPKEERIFSIRLYHLAKWLDLQGAHLPAMGTLLIDEAHDLAAPWYALLQRYSGGWLTMGDPYQRINGRAARAPVAKTLTMTQSVRTGVRVEPMIRRTMGLHSTPLIDGTFSGSRDHATRYRAFERGTDLPEHGLRVYGNTWTLLDDALRMRARGGRFRIIPASAKQMDEMAKDAISLLRYGDRPKHYHLRNFTHWDELAGNLRQSGHLPLLAAFERGLAPDDIDAVKAAQAPDGTQDLTLGLLEHCKNLEFSQVVMARCCFTAPNERPKDELVKGVYVAMTRVRDELWLPGDALDRLTDQLSALRDRDD
jgi:hypothetical protein